GRPGPPQPVGHGGARRGGRRVLVLPQRRRAPVRAAQGHLRRARAVVPVRRLTPATMVAGMAHPVTEQARAWIADDPDPADREELRHLLDRWPDSADDLTDRFREPLRFGTAGLRGRLRAG